MTRKSPHSFVLRRLGQLKVRVHTTVALSHNEEGKEEQGWIGVLPRVWMIVRSVVSES